MLLKIKSVTAEFIDYSLLDSSPLPQFHVNWKKPRNWESMIAEVQGSYLRDSNLGKARFFKETLEIIESLIISKQHFMADDLEKVGLLSFAVLNLENLYLLFSDPEVTEIFANRLDGEIVISHRKYGRCLTNLSFASDLWDSLKIRAEYDSGLPLNSSNPALKFGIQSSLGNFRVSLQVEPLSTLGPTLSVRRLPKSAITLQELIDQKQIKSDIADYLLSFVTQRKNLIIAGEPGSGKTTLANALLLHAHKSWRLIVMEDAREISIDPQEFPLLVQYNMPSVGSRDRYRARADEISRLLHRSPDYVFLGEIQNQDDTKVAFEGFAAGIRGMATTHAKSIDGLLSRWTDSHNLPKELVSSIDLIVITSRTIIGGKVQLGIEGIYEQKAGEMVNAFE